MGEDMNPVGDAGLLRYHIPYDVSGNDALQDNIQQILSSRTYTRGENLEALIERIKEITQYEFAIPFGSCTTAIMTLSRWYRKLGKRKLITPAFTWLSTYVPFRWSGFDIQFVDIDKDTWFADFSNAKTDKDTVAVAVDTFGSTFPDDLLPPANEGWIDSAQSLGTRWYGHEANRVISLSASKIVTSGEGGFILTQDIQLANFVNDIQNWFSRMSELNAALGIAYLDHMDEIIRLKADIARTYRKTHGFDWQRIPFASNNYIVAGLVPSSSDMRKKNPDWEFRDYYQTMADENDETTSFEKALYPTVPIHLQSDLAITRYVSRHILAFPSWPQMPLERIEELRT